MTYIANEKRPFSNKLLRAWLIFAVLLSLGASATSAKAYEFPNCSKGVDANELKKKLSDALTYGAQAASAVAHSEMSRAKPLNVKTAYCIDAILGTYFKNIVTIESEKTTANSYVDAIIGMNCANTPNLCITIDNMLNASKFFDGDLETCNDGKESLISTPVTVGVGMSSSDVAGALK